jgi:dihydrofolate reductase
MLSLIYARSLDHCIGLAGHLPWTLPDEMAFFDCVTMGHSVIMGRRTYEDHHSLLPGRQNILVSRTAAYQAVAGVVCVTSLAAAVAAATANQVFVIGGTALFVAAFPLAARIFETVVDTRVEGDAVLPPFDFSRFSSRRLYRHGIDATHAFSYTVYLHQRKEPAP